MPAVTDAGSGSAVASLLMGQRISVLHVCEGHDPGGGGICCVNSRCHAECVRAMCGARKSGQGLWLLHRPLGILFFGEFPPAMMRTSQMSHSSQAMK